MMDDPAAIAARYDEVGRLLRRYEGGDDTALGRAEALLDWLAAHDPVRAENAVAVAVLRVQVGLARVRRSTEAGAADLDAVIDNARRALTAARAADPANWSAAAGLLAEALQMRYAWHGRPGDLDEAVALLRQAARAATGGNRATAVAALARCLLSGSDTSRRTDHVREAVEVLRAELDRDPPGPSRPPLLHGLGNALMRLYDRTADPGLLEQARAAYQAALEGIPPDDPRYPAALCSLGSALVRLHEHTGTLGPVESAVALYRYGLARVPTGRARRDYLDGLGYALRKRYDARGDPADLVECVDVLRQAVAGYQPDEPGQLPARRSLAQALRAAHLRTGDRRLLREAAQVSAAAARVPTAPVSEQIWALSVHGHVRAAQGRWAAATESLARAIDLMPRLASPDRLRVDRYYDLSRAAGLATSAASCALNASRPKRALELLEQGRGVQLNRRLVAHDELAPLWRSDPVLARRYLRLRAELDRPEPGGGLAGPGAPARPAWATARAAGVPAGDREAAWEELLRQIRARPGMAGFLRPASARTLLSRAGTGPVVLIVPSQYRSDALILRAGRLAVLRLPDLTERAVVDNAARLRDAAATAHDPDARARTRLAAEQAVRDILDWLWRTTVGPVLDQLGFGRVADPAEPWPRVWWCPAAPMSFFPLHAAQGSDGESALDRVVSSYIPTVTALGRVRATGSSAVRGSIAPGARAGASGPSARSCVVALSEAASGVRALPRALHEARIAAAALPGARITAATAATRDRVLEELTGCAYAHFACHAVVDPQDPAASRLILSDHRREPLTVADVSHLDLTHAQLAYLSACSTALGPPRLADEALHIAGAFLLAGFRHVIGTLWETDDDAAVRIAQGFYARLWPPGQAPPAPGNPAAPSDPMAPSGPTAPGDPSPPRGPTLGPLDPARALHHAVRALRQRYRDTPTLWAAHIHTGP